MSHTKNHHTTVQIENVQMQKYANFSYVRRQSSESPNLIGFHWSLMTTAGNPEHTLPIQFQHCYILTLQANGKTADNISQNFEHHKYKFWPVSV